MRWRRKRMRDRLKRTPMHVAATEQAQGQAEHEGSIQSRGSSEQALRAAHPSLRRSPLFKKTAATLASRTCLVYSSNNSNNSNNNSSSSSQ